MRVVCLAGSLVGACEETLARLLLLPGPLFVAHGHLPQGCICFEWDPAKMGGANKGMGTKGKAGNAGDKVVLPVIMLTRLALRVFVDKSAQV